MHSPSIRIHVLVRRESDWWVAQCLEYDIAAQARTLPDLRYEFFRTFFAHLFIHEECGLDPFERLSPAPQPYWDEWREAEPLGGEVPHFVLPEGVPPAYQLPQVETRVSA